LLAPFAPHIIEELWQTKVKSQKSKVLKFKSIFEEKRPECDLKLLKEEKIILVVQINGKFRDGVEVDANISEQEAKKIVLSLGKIQKWLQGKEIKKIIFIPQKLINIVI
jgi:leucyl-tRNA synthetase